LDDRIKDMSSWYLTSHLGPLSLLPSVGWEMSIGQGAVAVLYGWEVNCRSGVALAKHHRLQWFINGLRKRDKHPVHNSLRRMAPFTFLPSHNLLHKADNQHLPSTQRVTTETCLQ